MTPLGWSSSPASIHVSDWWSKSNSSSIALHQWADSSARSASWNEGWCRKLELVSFVSALAHNTRNSLPTPIKALSRFISKHSRIIYGGATQLFQPSNSIWAFGPISDILFCWPPNPLHPLLYGHFGRTHCITLPKSTEPAYGTALSITPHSTGPLWGCDQNWQTKGRGWLQKVVWSWRSGPFWGRVLRMRNKQLRLAVAKVQWLGEVLDFVWIF